MKVIFKPSNQKFHSPPWDWIKDLPIYLTRNKIYEVFGTIYDLNDKNHIQYLILNDDGLYEHYNDYHFVGVDKIREEKIDILLD